MAYCIAMDTFLTYYYLLEDLVAHGRNRIFGIVWKWDADMQAVMCSVCPSVMVNERKDSILRCLVRVTLRQHHACPSQ